MNPSFMCSRCRKEHIGECADVKELKQQRDELLAALKYARLYIVGEALPIKGQALNCIDAAIAKVKEQK